MLCLGDNNYKIQLHLANQVKLKGWEAMILIKAFGLSEEMYTKVGFAFSNNGWKSQDLQFRMKRKIYDLFNYVS